MSESNKNLVIESKYPSSAESYQQESTRLSTMLKAVEDELQVMPVSEVLKYYVPEDKTQPRRGLEIKRSKNRWVLNFLYVPTELEQNDMSPLALVGVKLAMAAQLNLQYEAKPLLTCTVEEKAWAALQLEDFLEFAIQCHMKRMSTVMSANNALCKVLQKIDTVTGLQAEDKSRAGSIKEIKRQYAAPRGKVVNTTKEGK